MTRRYYPRRIGIFWEVWFENADQSADPANGATRWRALWGVRFLRWINAARAASALSSAYSDGHWIASNPNPQSD